jgi:hypothetical protein
MRLAGLKDPQTRDRYLSIVKKRLLKSVRQPRECKPVFVFGKQRSGTSMLMIAFHRHPEAIVYDEHRSNAAFYRHRIRDFEVVRQLVDESRFGLACFKPICDSHFIARFVEAFPSAHHIWIYRRVEDVANSSLRKFADPTRALRLVCTGQAGGGWFDEGVSLESRRILREVYRPSLSDFDLACLAWWARNRIIVESGLLPSPDITVLKYEDLVADPQGMLWWLFARMNVPFNNRIGARMTPRPIGRHRAPPMDDTVRELCESLTCGLDEAYFSLSPPRGAA